RLMEISFRQSNDSLYVLDCGRSKIYSWIISPSEPDGAQEQNFSCGPTASYYAAVWDSDDQLVLGTVSALERYDASFVKQTSISVEYYPSGSGYLDGSNWVVMVLNSGTTGDSGSVYATDVLTGAQSKLFSFAQGDLSSPP